MPPTSSHPILIVGAGAAGLMAARELARTGRQVSVLEARDRLGGRIWPLPVEIFGYPAEGGAEFVHGAAPVTRALMREARLTPTPMTGSHWDARREQTADDTPPGEARFQQVLAALETDMPIAEFLETRFGGPQFAGLRRSITRMVEGYDAADPRRASTFALRDEWMGDRGLDQQGRIAQGYGALIDFLAADASRHGVQIRLACEVVAIELGPGSIALRLRDGSRAEGEAIVLTVPLPVLAGLVLPAALRETVAAATADIGFGNVVKFLLRFRTRWWLGPGHRWPADLSFLFSGERVPTWWTQHPADHAVLTGWFAGPRAESVAGMDEEALIEMGLAALAATFERPIEDLRGAVVAARALNWGNDPLARGAYSYATPATRAAQIRLGQPFDRLFISGEALYAGHDMGTVEAALAAGRQTAQALLKRIRQVDA